MTPLPIKQATMLAGMMMAHMAGRVSRIEIAGSVARKQEVANNIDLVLIPKPDPQRQGHTIPFFFKGQMTRLVKGKGSPELTIRFADLVFRPMRDLSTPVLFLLETVFEKENECPEGIRVNVSIATEENWGSVLLFRTGNKAHNIFIATRAVSKGLLWSPFANNRSGEAIPDGLFDPKNHAVVASKTEQDIFKALKMKYVKPEKRERKS